MIDQPNQESWKSILNEASQIMIPRYQDNIKYSSSRLFEIQKPHLDKFMEAAQSSTGICVLRELLKSDDFCSRYWSAYGLMKYGEAADRRPATDTLAEMIAMPRHQLDAMQKEMCFYALAALSEFDIWAALDAAQRRPGRPMQSISLPPDPLPPSR